jgi:hypothetical protein
VRRVEVVEEVDYFQDMEPTYVRPTIIHKPTTPTTTTASSKPQASRLALDADADAAWVLAPTSSRALRITQRTHRLDWISSHTLSVCRRTTPTAPGTRTTAAWSSRWPTASKRDGGRRPAAGGSGETRGRERERGREGLDG